MLPVRNAYPIADLADRYGIGLSHTKMLEVKFRALLKTKKGQHSNFERSPFYT